MHASPSAGLLLLPSLLVALTLTAAVANDAAVDLTGGGEAVAFGLDGAEDAMSAAAVPVSPGEAEAGVRIAETCPTFSWGAAPGAERYELAVFDAWWLDSADYAAQVELGQILDRIDIDAPATSWTPAGEACLEDGAAYRWFVRPHTAEGAGRWSSGRYFEIDYDCDALTQTVRRELTAQLRRPEVWREVIQSALSSNGRLALSPVALGAVAPAREADGSAAAGADSGGLGSVSAPAIGVLATTFPSALKINSPNGVVFNQSATGGGIPAAGAGTRFMWYPGKAALRAGYVEGTHWDNDNMGSYSTAMGYSTKASGLVSTAMGDFTVASGYRSTAMGEATNASGLSSTAIGYISTASGDRSTAMGEATTASGYASTAMGFGTAATGDSSTAIGIGTTASGGGSTAMGVGTTASGPSSTGMGDGSTASGESSTAMGKSSKASGLYSTAMGWYSIASGSYSTAIGDSTTAESGYEMAIGRYNTDYDPSSTTDWSITDRLFVIGNGTFFVRSDALVVLKNGNVGIGTSTPNHRLQLGTDSAAKPGTNTWTVDSDARLKDITGPYESGLEEIAALQPVRYHYAVDNARGHDPEPEYVGFIAQQAQAVFPEAVSEGADGYLDFNMHAVNVAMVNAIQTLREQNQEQQEQISGQQDLIAELRTQNQSQQDLLQTQQAQIAAFQSELKAQKEAHHQEIAALKTRNEAHAAQLDAERSADLALIRAELQRLRARVNAQPSVQRTAALP